MFKTYPKVFGFYRSQIVKAYRFLSLWEKPCIRRLLAGNGTAFTVHIRRRHSSAEQG